jgi:hypothetical protein
VQSIKAAAPAAAPVAAAEPEGDAVLTLDIAELQATLLDTLDNEALRQFCAELLVAVADRENAQGDDVRKAV